MELLGRLAEIVLDGVAIARMRSWNLTINGEVIDVTEFGDTWVNNQGGIRSFTSSIEGMMDLADSNQDALRIAAEDGTKLTTLELYVDGTSYFAVDLISDTTSGMYITSYTVTSDNKSVVSFTMTVVGTGTLAWHDLAHP